MVPIQIQNAKGLYARAFWRRALTEAAVDRIRQSLGKLDAENPKMALDARRALAALERMPLVSVRLFGEVSLSGDLAPGDAWRGEYKDSERLCRAWIDVMGFASANRCEELTAPAANADALGWAEAGELAKMGAKFERLLHQLQISNPKLRAASVYAKWRGGEAVKVSERSKVGSLTAADAFCVYMPDAQGFLNDKGASAPLGGARLFESPGAAARTVSSRRISPAAVVRVQARIVALDPILNGGNNLGALRDALASEEARQLREALRQADIDTLRARLAELEAEATKTDPKSAASAQGESAPQPGRRILRV
jgi:hypothetical protein